MLKSLLYAALFIVLMSAVAPASDDVQPDPIQDAAREYRIWTYDNFRLDRDQYDRRRQAADELLQRWTEAGSRASQGEVVVSWFAAAKSDSRTLDLPALPELTESKAKVAEAKNSGQVKQVAEPVPQYPVVDLSQSSKTATGEKEVEQGRPALVQPGESRDVPKKISTPGGDTGFFSGLSRTLFGGDKKGSEPSSGN